MSGNLSYLAKQYGARLPSNDHIERLRMMVTECTVDSIFDNGLHEFIMDFLKANSELGSQIELDYRFYG
jgi:uncharacterized alpha-E superfamily protein